MIREEGQRVLRIRPNTASGVWMLAILGIIFFSGLLVFSACSRNQKRANVLLIVVDALRADHLGAYGYARETSPFFDRFSKQGVLFEHVTSQSSWTKTSMASLFSGLEAETVQVFGFKDTYPEEVLTLAEILSRHGYETSHIQTNAWLYQEFGFNQGFGDYAVLRSNTERWPDKKAAIRAWAVNEQARAWLSSRDRDRPFFLYLHYMDVHDPYIPPPPHNRMFDPEFPRELRDYIFSLKFLRNEKYIFSPTAEQLYEQLKQDQDMLAHLISLYDGEIHYFDQEFESLMAYLEETGLIENTLIIFASDHGEQFLEHGALRHGTSLYREELEVPLVFSLPGALPADRRIKHPVRNLDIMPTVLDILGIQEELELEGRSLYPLMRGRADKVEPACAYSRLRLLYDFPENNRDQALIQDREWVLIKDFIRGSQELYNLAEDPDEKHDLADKRPDRVKDLSARLVEHLETVPALRNRLGLPDVPVKIRLDEKIRKSLEAVGYFNK
jgi:arylsulfatase A-like enzyme